MHYYRFLGTEESARELWENEEALRKYLNRLRELMTEGKKLYEIAPAYCDEIPQDLEPGKLYISKKFEIAVHLCACGCGGKTVTPIMGEGDWVLTENDGKVTLRPSIGNWSGENPYHAHYLITDNEIQWY